MFRGGLPSITDSSKLILFGGEGFYDPSIGNLLKYNLIRSIQIGLFAQQQNNNDNCVENCKKVFSGDPPALAACIQDCFSISKPPLPPPVNGDKPVQFQGYSFSIRLPPCKCTYGTDDCSYYDKRIMEITVCIEEREAKIKSNPDIIRTYMRILEG